MHATDTLINQRYRIVRLVGQGGMGAVYEAVDVRLGNHVALKQTTVSSPDLDRAFEREAKLLANLRHPALPRVTDYFTSDNGQFLVMDFIGGTDLGALLEARGGSFPLDQVLGWADTLLDALDYLHRQPSPVIHRDIKPQNIKLTPEGRVVLLDFGLAKGAGVPQTQVTAASIFGYTPRYAPLEQIQGTGTEPRSDLYSLAATLLHLLTGVEPVNALNRAAAVLNRQPDPQRPAHELNPQVPRAVAEVLAQALALGPSERQASAAALRAALQRAAAQPRATVVINDATTVAEQAIYHVSTPAPSEPAPYAAARPATPPVGVQPPPSVTEPPPARRVRWPLVFGAGVLATIGICCLLLVGLYQYGTQIQRDATAQALPPTAARSVAPPAEDEATPPAAPTASGKELSVDATEAPAASSPPQSEPPPGPGGPPPGPGGPPPGPGGPPPGPGGPPPVPGARRPFPADQVQATLDDTQGTVGAVVYDVENDQVLYQHNQAETFPSASLIKLPIVMTVYHLAQQKKLDLDEQITLREADKVGGSGSIRQQPAGARFTIRELCARMLRESDNTAANLVLNKITFAPVNALLDEIGAKQTRVQRLMLDTDAAQAGHDNLTTPQDMLTILKALGQGALIDASGTNEIHVALTDNIERTKLPAQLPPDTQTTHKTGTLEGVEHDAGQVTLPDGRRYIVVIMSQDVPDNKRAVAAIAQASRQIYDWFAQR